MKYQITERTRAWVVFIESADIRPLCTIADAVEQSFSGLVSEIRYNRCAGQGVMLLAKSDGLSHKEIDRMIKAAL
jgi:hypothetical protein